MLDMLSIFMNVLKYMKEPKLGAILLIINQKNAVYLSQAKLSVSAIKTYSWSPMDYHSRGNVANG